MIRQSPANRKLLISIVVPVYNEQENIDRCVFTVRQVMESVREEYDYELIFTDNHSTDSSFEKLRVLAANNPKIRVFRFARNHGFQKSILTGFRLASGDAAIQLDCDLEDPPDLIPQFLEKWNEGFQVVYGIRRRRHEAIWITWLRKAFYRTIDLLSEDKLPHDAGDFRLVDRCVLDLLGQIDDQHPYLRGTIAAMGFEQVGIPYDRSERVKGRSKFSLRDLFRLATDGIVNHSLLPLRLATLTGFLVSIASVLTMIAYMLGRLSGADWPAGFATLTVLMLLSLGTTSMFLGIIGEYIGRIYQQVKRRPLTIVEQSVNPSPQPPALYPSPADRPSSIHFAKTRAA